MKSENSPNTHPLKVVSSAQMREIDRLAIEKYGVPELVLMENAGIQSMLYLQELLGGLEGKRIGIFCGKGNNGGDGFVLARHLFTRGLDPAVYLVVPKGEIKGSAKINMEAYLSVGGRMKEFLDETDLKKHKIAIRHADVLVDALLGTGLNAELKGMYKTAVEKINDWKRFCLALDVPTGLSADKGAIYGLNVRADATITFGLPKTGLMFYPSAESVGRLKTADISFPPPLIASSPCEAFLPDSAYIKSILPPRPPTAHKGTYGHVVVTGGSEGMGGAVALSALAALKVGAGLSTAAVPADLAGRLELGVLEVMSLKLGAGIGDAGNAEKILKFSEGKSAILIGPGMGRSLNREVLALRLAASLEIPMVIDADGLNNIAGKADVLKSARAPVVITPHPGEMASLTGKTTAEINADRLTVAKSFSKEFNCVTVLKGARTVTSAPDGTAFINPTGNQNLASGGTGDVLGGMIAGYIAQGLSPLNASVAAVYVHGLSADIYTMRNDPYSLTATALIDYLPQALSEVLK
ncbi:MAG: NAD(P)H-hydrate dehydratase [Nitrospinae bacterium]|nr:NAD(P)H-hydrate dehydratase [Nitrospinota bacterium]